MRSFLWEILAPTETYRFRRKFSLGTLEQGFKTFFLKFRFFFALQQNSDQCAMIWLTGAQIVLPTEIKRWFLCGWWHLGSMTRKFKFFVKANIIIINSLKPKCQPSDSNIVTFYKTKVVTRKWKKIKVRKFWSTLFPWNCGFVLN